MASECGALLLGADPRPRRHQVSELPHVEPEITGYQMLPSGPCAVVSSGADAASVLKVKPEVSSSNTF